MELVSDYLRRWPGSIVLPFLLGAVGPSAAIRVWASPELLGNASLSQPLTLQTDGWSVGDFLASLEQQTGVRLTCAPGLAEVPLTLFIKAEPVHSVMEGLAEVVGGRWEPMNDPPGYCLREEEPPASPPFRRSGDMQDLLARILTETFEAVVQAVSGDDQEISQAVTEQSWLAPNLSGPRRHLAVLLAHLTPEQRERLAQIASVDPIAISATDQSHLYSRTLGLKPYSTLSASERAAFEGYFAEAEVSPLELVLSPEEEETTYVGLVSTGSKDLSVAVVSPQGFWVITNRYGGFVWSQDAARRWGEVPVPLKRVCFLTSSEPARQEAEEAGFPEVMELFIQVGPDFLSQRIDCSGVVDPCSRSHLLLAIHQQLGLSVICEAYTRTRISPFPWARREFEMREALEEMADVFDLHIRQRGNLLLLRSACRQKDREYEVPTRIEASWRIVKQQRNLGLEALSEMAQTLSESQLTTLAFYSADRSLGGEALQILQNREILLLYASLTPEQRRQAQGTGLPVAAMNDTQQTTFRKLSWSGLPVFDPARWLPQPGLKVDEDAVRISFILQSQAKAAVQYEILLH